MKSNLYQIKVMDGTEKVVSNLLKEHTVSDDTKLVD
jgi:urease gamma subunit